MFKVPKRKADLIVGNEADPYLLRWHIIPENGVFNIYLHCFLRSDHDRALHDHPWWSVSFLLKGWYVEHTIAKGGIHHRKLYHKWFPKFRSAKYAHRIEVSDPTWTLFITGPKIRAWGFHMPYQGWTHNKEFEGEA